MENEQVAKRRKKEMREKAIREGGFYGRNGTWNSIITFPGDNRIYRERVETIVIKDGKFVFVKKKPDGEYFLPGGSTEKDISHMDQAINECQEEAHINVRNIQYTGITYKDQHETPSWVKKDCEVEWDATFTEVYVAEYDATYKGPVDKVDEDPFIRSGKFYPTKDCFKFFRKEHRDALLWYLKSIRQDDETITESYIGNYFKNKKLLKKISHNPEIERSAVDQIISVLKKEYSRLNATSKIQRERKRSDVSTIFHPVLTFDFSDGNTVTISICFDDSEFSEGVAIHSDKFGDMVVVYPVFFKSTKEDQIFTILHEFGHIRLRHLERWNIKTDLYGNDKTLEYRQRLMSKGRVMYPEVNADLYAILNGATMYSILNTTVSKDTDEQYDYRFTNQELANRYSQVFKKYGKLQGFAESEFSKYDIACLAIYEMVYMNDTIDYLTESEKDELYSILFEYGINNKIKDSNAVQNIEKEYKNAIDIYTEKFEEFKYIISNTIENADESDDVFKYLEESLMTPCDVGDTKITEKVELLNMRNNVNNLYTSLTFERAKAYNAYTESDDLEKPNRLGNNPQMAQIANYKSVFMKEMCETLDTMIYKLKTKEESVQEDTEKMKIKHYLYLIESLTSSERSKIPEDKFGIPDTRSYPLDTEKHVRSAVVLFGRADKKYQPQLAERIFKAMEEFNISTDMIGEKSQLYQFLVKYNDK